MGTGCCHVGNVGIGYVCVCTGCCYVGHVGIVYVCVYWLLCRSCGYCLCVRVLVVVM